MPGSDDRLDLTQTIKKLSMPTQPGVDTYDEEQGTALLLCSDAASRKWGPRWLNQVGLQANVIPDPVNALSVARETRPDVIIAEAGLQDSSGVPLFRALLDAADLAIPVIVMCANGRELSSALETDAFDIARKPFEWQVISRRARYAARLRSTQRKFDESRDSLRKALFLAEEARKRLRSRESFEPVTGLPNKSKFMELLRRGMAAVDRDGNVLGVFVIGFNRFRLVIEAMGQECADMVLGEIGRRLSECLRDAAPVHAAAPGLRTAAAATIDNFRFALMVTASADGDELRTLQEKVLERLARPIQVSGQTVYLSACLGVAQYPQDAEDADSLLQRADNAMRDAQSRGGGFKYYCTETDAAAARKLKLEHMLHEALHRKELSLAYQPIAEISLARVVSAEALLRWRQADGSMISPAEFVPVAEESGLMIHIGEFVLEEACKQLNRWRESGIPLPSVCVNVSKVQLMSGEFVASVKRILGKHGIDPSALELELSERGVLSGDYDVISHLHEIKNLGVRLSIDDFGTGTAAIAYLKELPVDVLKIDRSYVAGLTGNKKDAALTSAMVALGQRLELMVVAEGVETREQLAILQELGCDAFQGFLISQPVAGKDFGSLLKRPDPGRK